MHIECMNKRHLMMKLHALLVYMLHATACPHQEQLQQKRKRLCDLEHSISVFIKAIYLCSDVLTRNTQKVLDPGEEVACRVDSSQ